MDVPIATGSVLIKITYKSTHSLYVVKRLNDVHFCVRFQRKQISYINKKIAVYKIHHYNAMNRFILLFLEIHKQNIIATSSTIRRRTIALNTAI